MTLQSSGAISLANIQAEFGGSNPISLNEYYVGGANVPAGTAGIPGSGAISINQFYGKSKVVGVAPVISIYTDGGGTSASAIQITFGNYSQWIQLYSSATVYGGVASYSWSYSVNGIENIQIESPNSANTRVRGKKVSKTPTTGYAYFYLTIVDGYGRSGTSNAFTLAITPTL